MNLLPEVLVKVMASTQAQCVNTPDFLSLSVAETEMRMMVNSSTIDEEYALAYVAQKGVLS